MNPTVPENSYMSAYKKHVINAGRSIFVFFVYSVHSPNYQLTFIDRCLHVFLNPCFFSIAYGDISKIITVPDSCSI